MASRIKGIVVEIGGDTTGLDKALSATNTKIRNTQSQLRDVEKLLKLDPSNVTLLEQKMGLLEEAVSQTEKKLKALRDAEKQVQQQFEQGNATDDQKKQYAALQREIIATEQSLDKLRDAANKTKSALESDGEKIKVSFSEAASAVSSAAKKIEEKTKPLTTAVVAIGAAALATVPATEELRGDLSKLDTAAQESGVSADEAREAWRLFAVQSGETDSAVEATANLLQAGFTESNLQKAVEGLAGATQRFPDTLKIESLADSLQETLATGEATGQFGELLDRLGIGAENFTNELQKASTAAEKQNLVLTTLANAGLNDSYQAWAKNNSELLDYERSQLELQETMADFAALLTPILSDVMEFGSGILKWFNELDSGAQAAIGILTVLVGSISPIAGIISKVTDAASKLIPIISGISLNPIVLAATAIVGIGAGIAALSSAADEAVPSVESLTESATKLNEAMTSANESMEESETQTLATYDVAGKYVDRLKALEETGLKTEEQQQEWNSTLALLCQTVPELSQYINLQTGEIEGGTAAIENQIEAMKKLALEQIKQEKMAEITKLYADAVIEQATNEKQLANVTQELNAAEDQYAQKEERLLQLREQAKTRAAELSRELGYNVDWTSQLTDEYHSLDESLTTSAEEISILRDEQQNLTEAIAVGKDTVETAKEEYDLQTEAILSASDALSENTAQNVANAEAQASTGAISEEAAAKINALAESYTNAYNAAYSSISSQIGLFDLFNASTDAAEVSVTDMVETWRAQSENLAAYTENLRLAAQYGISDGLVAALSDGSVESVAYLQTIIDEIESLGGTQDGMSTEAQQFVDDFNAEYERTEEAKESFAATTAGLETEFSETLAEMLETGELTADQMETVGSQLVNGMIVGLDNQSSSLYRTMRRIVNAAIQEARDTAEEHSPAKTTIRIFENVGEGMIVGLENRRADLLRTMGDVVGASISEAQTVANTAPDFYTGMGAARSVSNMTENNAHITLEVVNNITGYDSGQGQRISADIVATINRALGRAY